MFSSHAIATFRAAVLNGPVSLAGKGRVISQLASETFVIALGKENVTIQLREGSLAVGDRVRVSSQDGGLRIELLPSKISPPEGVDSEDSFQQKTTFSFTDLANILDGIIKKSGEVSGGSIARAIAPVFAVIEADLERIDPKLTREIVSLLAAVAAALEFDPEEALRIETRIVKLLEQMRTLIPVEQKSSPGAERILFLRQNSAEGVYRFQTMEEAFTFLKIAGADSSGFHREMVAALDRDGGIVIRTFPVGVSGGAESAALLIRPDDLSREFKSLLGQFTSRAFSAIPHEAFLRVFNDRGAIDLSVLRFFDAAAASLQLPVCSARAGNADAQVHTFVQWLHSVLDTGSASPSLGATLPVFSMGSLIAALEEFAVQATPGTQCAVQTLLEQLTQEKMPMATVTDKKDFIASVFTKLGYDLEHTLAGAEKSPVQSLKTILLNASAFLQNNAPMTAPCPQVSAPESGTVLRDAETALKDIRIVLMNSMSAIQASVASIIDNSRVEGPVYEVPGNKNVSPVPPGLRQMLHSLLTDIKYTVEMLFSEMASELAETPKQSSLLLSLQTFGLQGEEKGPAPHLERDSGLPSGTALNQIEKLVVRLTEEIKQYVGRGSGDLLRTSATVVFEGQPPLLLKIDQVLDAGFRDMLRKLEVFREVFSMLTRQMADSAKNETSAAQTALVKNDAEMPAQQSPENASKTATGQALKQTVETLIARFESLQLLARQVAVPSGEQQIVSLPIKIGSDWVEAHIRLVKNREGGNGKTGTRRYAVYLNVAPSLLGAISVRMEYDRAKKFQMSMDFENSDVQKWFIDHSGQIKQALIDAGIGAPQVDFFLNRKSAALTAPLFEGAASGSASGILDVKA